MEWRRWFYALPARLRAIGRSRRVEQDLDDELSFHLAMQTRANLQIGMSEADAARRATHALGGVAQAKERCRDARPLGWANDFLQDLRYAWRSLRRTPGFTLVGVVTVALGIGANTALFSVIFAVLLRPLAYPDADRLVRLWTSHQPGSGLARTGTAAPDYRAWRSENRTFEEIGAFLGAGYNATGTDQPELLGGMRITASLWAVLKSPPQLGRTFSPAEEQWGSHRVVVLSDGVWRRRFGADPQVIGRAFELNGQSHRVIGVMPPAFVVGGPRTELWTPLSFAPGDDMDTRSNRSIELLGRLKPGVTLAQAQEDLSAVADRLARQYQENAGLGVTMEGWQENIVGASRPMLLLLLGAVACVLLIACANVANLLLARATTRQHELTVRATLGAGRGRLVRQLLTENLLLASLGATLGVALAYILIQTIPALGAIGVPRLREVTMDGAVVSFAVALTLLTGLAFGVWPARHGGRIGAAAYLKESAHTVVGGRMRARARKALIVAEVSLSFVLLVGAALLILSVQHLVRVDPGFQGDRLFTGTLSLPPVRYATAERVEAFIRQVAERVAALPGVESAGATTGLPLGGNEWGKYFSVDGRPAPASLAEVPTVMYRLVTPDYLRAMGASLRRGRLLNSEDREGQPPVAVINETIARRFWPDADPIGARISMNPPASLIPENIRRLNGPRPPSVTVVGVVGDFRHNGQEREINPEVFVPLAQSNGEFLPTFFLVARTAGDPLGATGAIQAAITGLDRNIPVANARTMESRLLDSTAQRRFAMWLLGAFAMLALLLALVGLYGVMAYTVSQRRQELGLRAVLGATAGGLLRLVLADGLRMTGIGVAIGLVLAFALSQFMSAQLFEVKATNPAVYVAVSVILLIVAGLACGVPAFRATRVDPAAALRCD